ncbi:MmcQ/YjbR family DNA-binding protein [Muribaculaceae bacterium Isolate-110 (HZI)]|uniref:MmcQ/YjbR family DNA-binding protein n=1 Tax=uncultured Duncaniella sp. TaxID=2768039 RepID=UPI000F4AB67C|nr:MmcQ/YjbR family DNA-binding protein [uncultured Duncaniella sp.]ROT18073.1 MmcQ/YjbR family DNA-binding protein [Muribaculaceae bacterium Isolate-110 (HZI)]
MNIEDFRDYCLSMDGVTEKIPFGKFAPRFDSTLVFYVQGHMFCMAGMDDFTSVSFRSTDEEIARISERYSAVTTPVNKAMKFWLRVNLNEDMPDSEIYSCVRCAYDIIKEKYSKTKKTQ